MKYMGSKRSMLKNGLGVLIVDHARHARRVVDLFCGAGAVAWFASEETKKAVLAVDLQAYAVTLASAIIGRDYALDAARLATSWFDEIRRARGESDLWAAAVAFEREVVDPHKFVHEARVLCEQPSMVGPVWNAYGGHYFSPTQALTLDYMLRHLPEREPERTVCLAALISTASKCAAAPGHTAQPFQPTTTAWPFLRDAWGRDPLALCNQALDDLSPRHAQVVGEAFVADAFDAIAELHEDDLVIADPPYSGVHYSRFYHVLETIARGQHVGVSGAGRYPPMDARPQSSFSVKSQSKGALENLFSSLSTVGATVIFTFPTGECSNGLSGEIVTASAWKWFDVQEQYIKGRFSTLGGNNSIRAARASSSEMVLVMSPK